MRWPLRYQILIPFALVLLGTIAAVTALNAVLAAGRAQRQIEDKLQGIAATLADSAFPLNDLVLRKMRGLSGAEFVFTDLNGRVLAASTDLQMPQRQNPAVAEQWQQLRLGPPVELNGQRFFEMVLAIRDPRQQEPGRLHILYPEGSWHEARSEAIVPPLVVGGLALVATALVALVIANRLTRPIIKLRSQVSRIAKADYTPIPLPERNDELRALAADVNRMAEQLAEMEKAIRRSERLALLGQLAGGLAHHLRNNVTGALMAVQLHARQCGVDRESLDVALRQLALTEENLKQFLAAPQAAPQANLALQCARCTLREIIEEVVELIEPSLRHRRVHLSVVEPPHCDDELNADRGQLRQLLMNLILNAADAAGPGGWVRIETDSSIIGEADRRTLSPGGRGQGEGEEPPTDSTIILRVLDNGPGPPREIVNRLFEPFATSKPEGIGLGLAVARQIAESHGGRIVFQHTDGETCFEVILPVARIGIESRAKPQAVCSTET